MNARLPAILLMILSAAAMGQEHHHGVARLGHVHFATSCAPETQGQFDRAVTLLHSFEFSEAIDGFKETLQADPTCQIAYWGIALSQWGNPFAPGNKDKDRLKAGQATAQQGLALSAKSDRERAYLAAVALLYRDVETTSQRSRLIAYRDAMQTLARDYPADTEAQIFYALAMAEAEDPADKSYAGRLAAGKILEDLFKQEPDHPGLAHYIIHAYDVPALAPRALDAARRYAAIAPDSPHALHMPSHIFTRVGYWQDSIDSNVASAAAAKRDGQPGEELHASDYEIYAYLQSGQDQAALRIVNALPEIESRFDTNKSAGGAGGSAAGFFALAAIPARYALEHGDWFQASKLKARETPYPFCDAMTWFARGLGAARLRQLPQAEEAVTVLEQTRGRLASSGDQYWALQADIQAREVRAWAALADGKKQAALRDMQDAVALEDGTEKSAVTPGPLAPARELLGEMLLETGQPALALEQFEAALRKEPGRFRSLYGAGRAAQLAGKPAVSRDHYRELLKISEHGDTPGRPELIAARKSA